MRRSNSRNTPTAAASAPCAAMTLASKVPVGRSPLAAQARSACAQMHSGFFALRGAMPFDLSRDKALDDMPLDVQVDIDRIVALWSECRVVAKDSGPFLFGKPSLADAFFAPVAVRLRTYRVEVPAEAATYIETIYQWPAFKAWQRAGLAEREV